MDVRGEAVVANLLAFLDRFLGDPRFERLQEPDVLAQVSDVAHPMFNVVAGARFGADARARAAAVAGRMMARGLPFLWWVDPAPGAAEVEAVLLELGLVPVTAVGMHRDLGRPAAPAMMPAVELEVVGADDPRFTDLTARVFELPDLVREPMRATGHLLNPDAVHLLAHLHGQPVAAGSGVENAGSWGLYNIATLPEVRGQGLAYDVVNALVAAGRLRGLADAVLHASDAGQSVYRRAGFEPVMDIKQYLWLP